MSNNQAFRVKSSGICWRWNSGIAGTWTTAMRAFMHSDVSIKDPGEGAGARVPFSHLSFRQKSKRLLAGGLFHSRLLRLLRRLEGSHILRFVPGSYVPQFRNFMGSKFGILCYHRVGIEGMPYHSRLEPRIFEAQMN